MIRFFVEPEDIGSSSIQLKPEDEAHIRSLRLRPSERFSVCDGKGFDYICMLGEKSAASTAQIVEKRLSAGEPSLRCSVYLAYAKGERLEYAVQKSVELGAYEIILFPCARCIAIPSEAHKKISRLQRISSETAKQSHRGRVPAVKAMKSFQNAIDQAGKADISLFFYECENKQTLKSALERSPQAIPDETGGVGAISIVTGPEGGFEPYEADAARAAGLNSVSLGPRILRCETAPAAALSAIMFYFNEF